MISRERKIELLKKVREYGIGVSNFIDEELAALENQELFEDNGTLETALQLAEEKYNEWERKFFDVFGEDFTDEEEEYFRSLFDL